MSVRRNVRRLLRRRQSEEVTPRELLYDVGDPRVQRLLDDITLVFVRTVPASVSWLERVNKNLEIFRLGAIVAAKIEGDDDLLALTWGMTLRAKEAADIKWGVGLPPISTARRKAIEERDPENPVSPFAEICTVVVRKAPILAPSPDPAP